MGQNTEYKWSYHAFFGAEDFFEINWSCYEKIGTNKVIGAMYDNTADGNFFSSTAPAFMEAKGYKVVMPSNYQALTEDFTAQISEFKSAGVECIMGNMLPPDFTNFWKQAMQQGFQPKVCLVGKAILFPGSVEALGDVGNGLMTELWWHRTFPWKSSLTDETCEQLAADFEAKKKQQATAPLLHYVCGEMAIDSLKRATDPKSKDAVLAAVEAMKLDTIIGPIDFTAQIIAATGSGPADWPAGPGRKTKNVYDHGLGGSQWLMQGGTYTFDQVPVDKAAAPYMLDDSIQTAKALPITA
jgi:branched-chain amino acid transport system substrate-binding protein